MNLKEYQVREFRSVWDSGPIAVGEVTCLVGKNEAGKTALLKALEKINPVIESHAKFDATDDYPRRDVNKYRNAVRSGERKDAVVVEATFELDDSDMKAVQEVFGPNAVGSELELSRGYSNQLTFDLGFDEHAARRFLSENDNLSDALKSELRNATDWDAYRKVLTATDKTPEVNRLLELTARFGDGGAASYAFSAILLPRVPKFLYFDEYYQMVGYENVTALIQREVDKKLKESDYPLLGLVHLAQLGLKDLLDAKRTTELRNMLEGAGNLLSEKILQYWSQNRHLQMRFDVREGRPEDPEGMRSGPNIWGGVYDTVHLATTELGTRSKGFVWFFSFLAWYEDIKGKKENVILLLDEPGLSLHGTAQADLLGYIEKELKPYHQVIFTTHSPFMIDMDHFDRVRVVQDKGIDAEKPLPREQDGTKVVTDIFDASEDSLFPLQGALGYEIHQTLFVGPNSLVVEGAADMLFLRAMSGLVEREGGTGLSERWTITPVGGAGKVPTFVALLAPQKGLNIATLLDIQADTRDAIENLYTKKLLEKKRVTTYADFVGGKEADVEDMFERDFYLGLVNAEFAKTLQHPLALADLNPNKPRVLRQIEDALTRTPLTKGEFGHYRPARYFFENIGALAAQVSPSTKERFAKAFETLNALLR